MGLSGIGVNCLGFRFHITRQMGMRVDDQDGECRHKAFIAAADSAFQQWLITGLVAELQKGSCLKIRNRILDHPPKCGY